MAMTDIQSCMKNEVRKQNLNSPILGFFGSAKRTINGWSQPCIIRNKILACTQKWTELYVSIKKLALLSSWMFYPTLWLLPTPSLCYKIWQNHILENQEMHPHDKS